MLRGAGEKSLWDRNVELAWFGSVWSLAAAFALPADRERYAKVGFFAGYTPLVWAVVILQSVGGLLVAMVRRSSRIELTRQVVRAVGAVGKGFATSVAIILSGVLSAYSAGAWPEVGFIFGAALVVFATLVFSSSR